MWTQILGHQKQIVQLKKAVAEGKVPHAYLFSGVEGIGKKMVALGLAQTLLGKINSDCMLVEPDGKTIRVEVLRELKQKAYLHPLEGTCKIFIIDSAEKMTTAGANALLKILEEPPAQTYFVLITSTLSQILPTIRSRCQILEFGPLNKEIIVQKLKELGKPASEAETLAHYAQGSLQRALEFDPAFLNDIREKLDSLKQNRTPSSIIKLSEALAEEEEKLPLLLNTLSFLIYEKINQAEESKIGVTVDHWLAIQKTKNQLDHYVNKRLLLENLFFRLSAST